jgi:hypothetical protein
MVLSLHASLIIALYQSFLLLRRQAVEREPTLGGTAIATRFVESVFMHRNGVVHLLPSPPLGSDSDVLVVQSHLLKLPATITTEVVSS